MKILVIMKRFGANKDMVMQNFGRQIRLFEPLAKRHIIHFFCPDYTKKKSKIINRNGIKYIVKPVSLFSLIPFYNSLKDLIKNGNYDVITATTDPLIGIISYHFSKKYKIPFVYDLQDNYEIYGSYNLPFVRFMEHNVIKKSDYVFYSNYALMRKLRFLRKNKIDVIENGVDLKLFKKIPKKVARKALKIDQNIRLITYTGHISKLMNIHNLIETVRQLREKDKSIYLFLSGKVEKDVNIKLPFIIYKKLPKKEQLVLGLNASDVLVIPSDDNIFSRYAFPQKLFEYMAVDVPIVATAVGDVKRILQPFQDSLCKPGSIEDLKDKINIQLKNRYANYRKIAMDYTWKKLSTKLDRIIDKC